MAEAQGRCADFPAPMTNGWRITIEPGMVGWKWEVYHSGYGLAHGVAWVKKRAKRYAREAIADLVLGTDKGWFHTMIVCSW